MTEKLLVPDIGDFENVEVIELLVKEGQEIKKDDPIDVESSGVYLVRDVEHGYFFSEGTSGTVITTLQLFRDSFGMKDKETTHGQ